VVFVVFGFLHITWLSQSQKLPLLLRAVSRNLFVLHKKGSQIFRSGAMSHYST